MPEVVVVGAGFSGLVACYELEKRGVPYSIIEVKREVGGTLRTIQDHGFVIDPLTFAIMDNINAQWLQELKIQRTLYGLKESVFAFEKGAQTLVNALSERLTAPRMMRMAVSTIGMIEGGRLALCLENGMMLNTDAIILATPARYTARIVQDFLPIVANELADYHYDTIHRVSLGYHRYTIDEERLRFWGDPAYVFHHKTEYNTRVPNSHVMFQVGTRLSPERATPEAVLNYVIEQADFPKKSSFTHVAYWAEADPLSCYDDHHPQRIAIIQEALPKNLAIIGSDYSTQFSHRNGVVRLDDRIAQAQRAVAKILG